MLKSPKNLNYCASVVKLEKFIELPGCNNIKHAIVFSNSVIVDKNTAIGEVGLFFPLETALSDMFLKNNNLYRDKSKNINKNKKGYFDTQRIRCVKLRGYKSEGFYIPLDSLNYLNPPQLNLGDEFDYIGEYEICKKYELPQSGSPTTKKDKKVVKRITRLVENQFRLAEDTSHLARNIHLLSPGDTISITKKVHGCNLSAGNVLVKKKLGFAQKIFKFLGADINDIEHQVLYASRRVVKNDEFDDPKKNNHYYDYDVWKEAVDPIREFIEPGITLYAELAGYVKTGGFIQPGYTYGCEPGKHRLYIYRITNTDKNGKVFNFSYPMMTQYCNKYGLEPAPLVYHGRAGDLFNFNPHSHWHENMLERLKQEYVEDKICDLNPGLELPAEGIVVVKEQLFDYTPWKLKSFAFLQRETELLDQNITNVEDQQVV